MSAPITPHKLNGEDMVTLEELVALGESPWKIDRLRQIARMALDKDPRYKRLPFFQTVKKSQIRVPLSLFRRRVYEMGANPGYREAIV